MQWLLPPFPIMSSALASLSPLCPKLPATKNLVPRDPMTITFSALKSQLRHHLLKEDFGDLLNQSTSLSILLPG